MVAAVRRTFKIARCDIRPGLNMDRRTSAVIIGLAAPLMYGFLGYFSDIFTDNGIMPVDVSFIRNIVPLVPLAIIILTLDAEAFRIRPKDIWIFALIGGFKAICDVTFFKAMTLLPISIATVLQMTASTMVIILTFILFRSPITKKKLISVALCLVGACLVTEVFTGSGDIDMVGVLFALLSAFTGALFFIANDVSVKHGYDSFTSIFYAVAFGSLFLLPFANLPLLTSAVQTPLVYNSMIITGVGLTLIPLVLIQMSMKSLDASTVSIFGLLEVPAAALVGFFLLDETLGAVSIIGMAIILISAGSLQIDFVRIMSGIKGKKRQSEDVGRNVPDTENSERVAPVPGMRKYEIIVSLGSIMVLFTAAATILNSGAEGLFGTSVGCVTAIAMLPAAYYYFYLGSLLRAGEIAPVDLMRRAVRCIGGVFLFMGFFNLPYDLFEGIASAAVGVFLFFCGYRLGKGTITSRHIILTVFLILLVAAFAIGVGDLRERKYIFIGICNMVTAVLYGIFIFDRDVFSSVFMGDAEQGHRRARGTAGQK